MNTSRRGFLTGIAKTLLTVSMAGAVGSTPSIVESNLQELRIQGSALRKYRWSDRPKIEYNDINEAMEARGLNLIDWAPKPDGDVCRIYVSDTSQVKPFHYFTEQGLEVRVSPQGTSTFEQTLTYL